jgi:hypothetical protein
VLFQKLLTIQTRKENNLMTLSQNQRCEERGKKGMIVLLLWERANYLVVDLDLRDDPGTDVQRRVQVIKQNVKIMINLETNLKLIIASLVSIRKCIL